MDNHIKKEYHPNEFELNVKMQLWAYHPLLHYFATSDLITFFLQFANPHCSKDELNKYRIHLATLSLSLIFESSCGQKWFCQEFEFQFRQGTHLTIAEFHVSYGICTWLSPSLAPNLASTLPHLPLPHSNILNGMAKFHLVLDET